MALPADPARFAENLERQLPVVVAPRQQARRRRPGEQHRLRPRVGVNEQKLKE
ncbi:MAG: hypothetical protein K8U03_25840 [Planctomycetia bacterium]|nr:hypothetical protein [Planctomycetia bacterium]